MSFVQRLRMANMFPIRSDIGNARIDTGRDDMHEVINAGRELALFNRDMLQGPSGLEMVAGNQRQPIYREPLRFGGVTEQSNPGADILARSKASADNTYAKMNAPQPQAADFAPQGPSRDDSYAKDYFDRINKEKTIDANIKQNERKITNEEKRLEQADDRIDNTGWTVGMIPDPKDPNKQISVRINSKDGRVEPIKMGDNSIGSISKPGTNKGSLIQPKNLDAIRASTQETLNQLDEIIDEKGNFTPQGARAVGWTAIGNKIPFTDNKAGSNSIKRLKSLLIKDLIGEMKNQSRTGATGYGALNLGELNLLKQGADKLDTLTDESVFREEAKRIREKLNKILQDEPTNEMKPAINHVPEGKIKVRRKSDGKLGFISKLTPEFEVVQ